MTDNIIMAQPIMSSKRVSWYIILVYSCIVAYISFYFTQSHILNTLLSDIKKTSDSKPIVESIPNETCLKKEEYDEIKLNSNMTIIDVINNKDFVKFIEPYLFEFYKISYGQQPYLHTPKENMFANINYLKKNYPSVKAYEENILSDDII